VFLTWSRLAERTSQIGLANLPQQLSLDVVWVHSKLCVSRPRPDRRFLDRAARNEEQIANKKIGCLKIVLRTFGIKNDSKTRPEMHFKTWRDLQKTPSSDYVNQMPNRAIAKIAMRARKSTRTVCFNRIASRHVVVASATGENGFDRKPPK